VFSPEIHVFSNRDWINLCVNPYTPPLPTRPDTSIFKTSVQKMSGNGRVMVEDSNVNPPLRGPRSFMLWTNEMMAAGPGWFISTAD